MSYETYLLELFHRLTPYLNSKIDLQAETKAENLELEGGFLLDLVFTKSKDGFEHLKKSRSMVTKMISQPKDAIYNSSTDTKTLYKTGQCVYFVIKGVDKINIKTDDKQQLLKEITIPFLIDDKEMKLTIKDNNSHKLIFETT